MRPDDAAEVTASDGLAVDPGVVALLLRTDPSGAWVVEDPSVRHAPVVAAALGTTHDLLYVLAVLRARSGHEHVLAPLLDAALDYGRGCLRGLARLTSDPGAAAATRHAGFDLHPTMMLRGRVRREDAPRVDQVRSAPLDAYTDVDSVDRQVRGAARGLARPDWHPTTELLVRDTGSTLAYAYHHDGQPLTIAGTSREAASTALWAVLQQRAGPQRTVEIGGLTAAQDWALDIGLAAGLVPRPGGYVATRHVRPPAPFIPAPDLY